MMRCCCGYLSGARCRCLHMVQLMPLHPKPNLLPYLNPDWFYLSGAGLPRLSWKRGVKWVYIHKLSCDSVCETYFVVAARNKIHTSRDMFTKIPSALQFAIA